MVLSCGSVEVHLVSPQHAALGLCGSESLERATRLRACGRYGGVWGSLQPFAGLLERATGFEPATSTLGKSRRGPKPRFLSENGVWSVAGRTLRNQYVTTTSQAVASRPYNGQRVLPAQASSGWDDFTKFR